MGDKIYAKARFAYNNKPLKWWEEKNPILENGEPSFVSDGKDGEWLKIGDGVTAWNDLPWKKVTQPIDQTYNSESKNAQSGKAVAEAIATTAGRKTTDSGEIFNDYENNIAESVYTHAEGLGTQAGIKGYKITDITLIQNDTDGNVKHYIISLEDFDSSSTSYTNADLVCIDANIHTYNGYMIDCVMDGQLDISWQSGITSGLANYSEVVGTKYDVSTEDYWVYVVGKSEGSPVLQSKGAHAEGYSSVAIGYGAHAEGYANQSIGNFSHTEGRNNVANYAAHAEGRGNIASGEMSHAEGKGTKALKEYAHAEGKETEAHYIAHAEGLQSKALGQASHAEGQLTEALALGAHAGGNRSIASGNNSFAMGSNAKAYSNCSVALGDSSQAGMSYTTVDILPKTATVGALVYLTTDGKTYKYTKNGWTTNADDSTVPADIKSLSANAFATGNKAKATGYHSFAAGDRTEAHSTATFASGKLSKVTAGEGGHACGVGIVVNRSGHFACGQYNNSSSNNKNTAGYNSVFTVGYGTSDTDRKNLLEVNRNGYAMLPQMDKELISDVPNAVTTVEYVKSAIKEEISNVNTSIDALNSKVNQLSSVSLKREIVNELPATLEDVDANTIYMIPSGDDSDSESIYNEHILIWDEDASVNQRVDGSFSYNGNTDDIGNAVTFIKLVEDGFELVTEETYDIPTRIDMKDYAGYVSVQEMNWDEETETESYTIFAEGHIFSNADLPEDICICFGYSLFPTDLEDFLRIFVDKSEKYSASPYWIFEGGQINYIEDLAEFQYYGNVEIFKMELIGSTAVDLSGYATKEYVDNAIGDIDLGNVEVKDGYTPVKGVDYWTEDDKQQIIDEVVNNLKISRDNNVLNLLYGDKVISSCQLRETVGTITDENIIELEGVDTGGYTLYYENEDGILSDYDAICELEVE